MAKKGQIVIREDENSKPHVIYTNEDLEKRLTLKDTVHTYIRSIRNNKLEEHEYTNL